MKHVTAVAPVDVTACRDPGMKAVILLAVSLGWNVMQKPNNPAIITAKDGHQKRIPTNTSIRNSVFQTAVNTVLLHTEAGVRPSLDLVDQIVKTTKLDKSRANYLITAIGETPQALRKRTENAEAPLPEKKEDHLTERVTIPPEVLAAIDEEVEKEERGEPDEREYVRPQPPRTLHDERMEKIRSETPQRPAERTLVSRKPLQAKYQTKGRNRRTYESKVSYELTYDDGSTEYECMICGKKYPSPKSVGSHYRVHIEAGEAERIMPPAVQARTTPVVERSHASIVAEIRALVAPDLQQQVKDLQQRVDELTAERDLIQSKYNKLRGDLQAFRDLLPEEG